MTDVPVHTDRLLAVQVLRAVAATMIVVLHAQGLIVVHAATHSGAFSPFKAIPLGAGVDLFFVISGFVIVYASVNLFDVRGGRWEFVRRRLIRILPLYWTALSLRLVVLVVGAAVGAKVFPGSTAIATSYLFIPYDSLGFGPDYPFPILDLGWTLNYEMFFYFLFTCFIGLRRDLAVMGLVACLSGAIVLATLFPPENIALRFWLQPIAVEFACGALIAWLYLRGLVLSGLVRIALIVAALVLWAVVPVSWFTDTSGPGFYSWVRVMIWGIGAILIVAGAAMGPINFHPTFLRIPARLGDSSYALYLLHPFVFLIVKAALAKVSLPGILDWPVIFAAAVLAIVSAAVFHNCAEIPVITWLKRVTTNRTLAQSTTRG
jgi:exopolysaccharide production protein ExoZ